MGLLENKCPDRSSTLPPLDITHLPERRSCLQPWEHSLEPGTELICYSLLLTLILLWAKTLQGERGEAVCEGWTL